MSGHREMRRLHRVGAWLLAATTAACSRNGANTHLSTQYAVAASYVGNDANGRPVARALRADAVVADCGNRIRVDIGPSCRIFGSWSESAEFGGDGYDRLWHIGSATLTPGQACRVVVDGHDVPMHVLNGVVTMNDGHVVDVRVDAETSSASGAATLSFAGAPAVPSVDADCR